MIHRFLLCPCLCYDFLLMEFRYPNSATAQLALDTILQQPTTGIPSWLLNIMQHSYIDRLAGVEPGSYQREHDRVYLAMQNAIGTCLFDQYLADNPLTMGDSGFESTTTLSATTGLRIIECDDLIIDSPEAVVTHLESVEFPRLIQAIDTFDEELRVQEIIAQESSLQEKLGNSMLKSGYGFVHFPVLSYNNYGYANYFSAYGLYPEIIEKHFLLQADLALLNNRAAARAYSEGNLPPLFRLDHDMADSRGTLVSMKSLEKMWLPHFSRCLKPLLNTNVRLIWHCDGNLMQMIPALLEVGIRGFQGFQYEDGMDYERICRMKAMDGHDLIIIAGVSVTSTLPFGSTNDVRKELMWLVENGPHRGLFLGASSSIPPGIPWENIQTLIDGLRYYANNLRIY
jgi:hypothetical protein